MQDGCSKLPAWLWELQAAWLGATVGGYHSPVSSASPGFDCFVFIAKQQNIFSSWWCGKNPQLTESKNVLEKCSFSQAGRVAHDFTERELRQTLLTTLAQSPHDSGVKVHILPFPPHTLISQQSEMTFSPSIERLIEPSTDPKDLIKAIFHPGEKSMQSTGVQLSRAASLCSIRDPAPLLPPHINFLCAVFCQLSIRTLMSVDFLVCVLLMIHFCWVSHHQ